MNRLIAWLTVMSVAAMTGVAAWAQEAAQPAPRKGDTIVIAERQRFIQQQFDKVLRQMTLVAERLDKTDPVSAKAMRQAADHARSANISGDMRKVIELLKSDMDAMPTEDTVVVELKRVIDILNGRTKTDSNPKIPDWLKEIGEARKGEEKLAGNSETAQPGDGDLGRQAGEQKKLTATLERLAGEMGKPTPGNPKGAPGSDKVSQAAQGAGKAGKNLDSKKPGDANKDQQQVVKDLKAAEEILRGIIAQTPDDPTAEKLATLAEVLSEMLTKQKALSAETRTVDGKRDASGTFQRQEELTIANLAHDEGALADDSKKIIQMLDEDGTTVVFPVVMKEVQTDLKDVQSMLNFKQTDPLTQAIQAGIERNLQELLNATQKELSRRKQRPSRNSGQPPIGQPPPPPEPPLVERLADIKLLKHLQSEINKRTAAVSAASTRNVLSQEQIEQRHRKLAANQKNVEALARNIRSKTYSDGQKGAGQ